MRRGARATRGRRGHGPGGVAIGGACADRPARGERASSVGARRLAIEVQAVVSQADAAVHDYVDVLRSRGISWTRIGQALGVSKQAAWERFSGED
jgi:hypothetical protein